MNKRILNTLLLGTVLFTSAVEAKSFNFKEYEVDISIDEEEFFETRGPFGISGGLGLLGMGVASTQLGIQVYRDIKNIENTDIVKLMSKRAELINIERTLVDKVNSLETTRSISLGQAHIERSISNLIHAGEDSLTHMYAPLSIHKKIIVNRIADTILDDGLKLDEEVRFAVVKNIESKMALGDDLTNNMKDSEVARKVSMLESEYRLITADAKVEELGMVHRSMKTSVISKSIRAELIEDLKNVNQNLETAKFGKSAVALKISRIEDKISDINRKMTIRKNYIEMSGDMKKSAAILGGLSAISYVGGAYLLYEVADKVIEIEVLENGSTRLISISDII